VALLLRNAGAGRRGSRGEHHFHDEQRVYVNLYTPSTVRWKAGAVPVSIARSTAYTHGDEVLTIGFDVMDITSAADRSVWGDASHILLNPLSHSGIEGTLLFGERVDTQTPLPPATFPPSLFVVVR